MNKKLLTSKEYFTSLTIVYFALLGGQVLLGAVSVFLTQFNAVALTDGSLDAVLLIVVSVFTLGGLAASHLLFKNRLAKIEKSDSLILKTGQYRTSLILKLALIEGPTFFAAIGYLLTANYLFLLFFGGLLLFYLTQKPSKPKLISDLQLNAEEEEKVYKPDAVISEVVEQPR